MFRHIQHLKGRIKTLIGLKTALLIPLKWKIINFPNKEERPCHPGTWMGPGLML